MLEVQQTSDAACMTIIIEKGRASTLPLRFVSQESSQPRGDATVFLKTQPPSCRRFAGRIAGARRAGNW
jgi:hypothetical protein